MELTIKQEIGLKEILTRLKKDKFYESIGEV